MNFFVFRIPQYLIQKGYIQFFIVGVFGLGVQLFVTWFFTQFIFGLERYFWGYLIGLVVTLFFNFFLHTFFTFKTKESHSKRFVGFVAHYIVMIFAQAGIVVYVTPQVGLEHYLVVIAIVIFVLSNFNFLFFKLLLFRSAKENDSPQYE